MSQEESDWKQNIGRPSFLPIIEDVWSLAWSLDTERENVANKINKVSTKKERTSPRNQDRKMRGYGTKEPNEDRHVGKERRYEPYQSTRSKMLKTGEGKHIENEYKTLEWPAILPQELIHAPGGKDGTIWSPFQEGMMLEQFLWYQYSIHRRRMSNYSATTYQSFPDCSSCWARETTPGLHSNISKNRFDTCPEISENKLDTCERIFTNDSVSESGGKSTEHTNINEEFPWDFTQVSSEKISVHHFKTTDNLIQHLRDGNLLNDGKNTIFFCMWPNCKHNNLPIISKRDLVAHIRSHMQ